MPAPLRGLKSLAKNKALRSDKGFRGFAMVTCKARASIGRVCGLTDHAVFGQRLGAAIRGHVHRHISVSNLIPLQIL